jgi:hypothetical protein
MLELSWKPLTMLTWALLTLYKTSWPIPRTATQLQSPPWDKPLTISTQSTQPCREPFPNSTLWEHPSPSLWIVESWVAFSLTWSTVCADLSDETATFSWSSYTSSLTWCSFWTVAFVVWQKNNPKEPKSRSKTKNIISTIILIIF